MHATEFLTKLKELNFEKLGDIKGLGNVLIGNLQDFVKSERYNEIYTGFSKVESLNQGIEIIETKAVSIQGILTGQTICITGSFQESRDIIAEKLTLLGGKITNIVSASTTILLVGEKPGSKVVKAEKLGIKIVYSLDELLNSV